MRRATGPVGKAKKGFARGAGKGRTFTVDSSASKGHNRGEGATLKDVLAYLALIGCALAFLWHFASIWLYGVTQATEPNLAIRSLETVLFAALLGLGIERMITAMKKGG